MNPLDMRCHEDMRGETERIVQLEPGLIAQRLIRGLGPTCDNGDPILAAPENAVVANADVGTLVYGVAFGVISIMIPIGVAKEGGPVAEALLQIQGKAIGFRRLVGFIEVPGENVVAALAVIELGLPL